MPFDGFCLPGSPLDTLLKAARKLRAERRAQAKLCPKPAPSAEKLSRRATLAAKSLVVIDLLEELLGDHGQHWMQNDYADGRGNYCLVGGLHHIRAVWGSGDHAGVYLSRAIAKLRRGENSIIQFNDSREDFGEIRAVILIARRLAREVADGQA